MRSIRPDLCLALTLGTSFLAACSGGSSIPSSPSSASSASSAAMEQTLSIPRSEQSVVALPATATVSNEQLLVLHQTCISIGQNGNCSNGGGGGSDVERVSRWQLASGSPLTGISLGGTGGAQFMAVSADDDYILSYDQINGVELDSTKGSRSTLIPPSIPVYAMVSSTNLLGDVIVEVNNNSSTYDAYGYHEPYTSSYGHVSIPASFGPFAAAANFDGSLLFIARNNGSSTQVSIGNLSTGAVQTTTFPESKGETPAFSEPALFDARHQWFYFLSSPDGNANTVNRVQIFSTKARTYLGYLNLPPSGGLSVGIALNINNSDLYVQVGSRVYVYNVGACGCATVQRSFTIPGYAGVLSSLDRTGTHLFTQGSSPTNQYAPVVYDFNPQGGALQRTFVVNANGSAGAPDYIVQTLGQ